MLDSESNNLPFKLRSKTIKRSVALMLLALVAIYGIVPNLHEFFGLNFHLLLPKHWPELIAALFLFYLTFFFSTLSYSFLAIRRIKRFEIFLIQLASTTLNLMLPVGIGNISANYLFLRRKQLSQTTAGLVVGLNNALGVAGNVTLLIVLLAAFGINHPILNIFGKHKELLILVMLLALLLLMSIMLFLSSAFSLARHLRRDLSKALGRYSEFRRWHRIVGAYGCALAQAAITAFVFWLSLKAFRINIDYPIAYLIYALSALIGGFFPTPGGLGGVEASLVAGIVAVHASDTALALSAVLAYRALSYWLPAFLGVAALFIAHKMRLIRLIS